MSLSCPGNRLVGEQRIVLSRPAEWGESRCLWPLVLNKAIAQMETEDGWVGLGAVGQRLANIASDFDPRTYGYRKLSHLVRGTTPFDMEQPEGRGLRIRTKPAKPRKARPKVTTAD